MKTENLGNEGRLEVEVAGEFCVLRNLYDQVQAYLFCS